jgi:long-chain acyl-CoA synthetase
MKVERLFDIPYYQLEQYSNEIMFSYKQNGAWNPISTSIFIELVNHVSKGLIQYGIKPNDKIAIVSPNRYEWNVLDIAIQQVGAIVIPIYPNISTRDYKYIFNDAKIKLAFLGTEELFEKISSIRTDIPTLEEVYTYDVISGATHWKSIFDTSSTHNEELENRKNAIKTEDLATIIYTSGTTGDPKGVMLSHRNILSNVEGSEPLIPADDMSRVITFLPVCHVYERMLHYLYMKLGASIYFAESLDTIGENIKEVKPHVFTAVPRLLEKVYDKIIAKGNELTGFKYKLFFWAVELAKDYNPQGNSLWYNFKLSIARKLIFSKWQEALGGEVRAIASGSAALSPQLCRIYLAAGINILEGYGLTETSPVISVNNLKDGVRVGTVGPLIQDVQVKFAEDGEILVKGPNVMIGYFEKPDKTAEAIDEDGWFHTGDIGEMIEGKFLKITDRKKEIFKTSGGKFIVPQPMENKFKESRFIEQIIVVGEGQKFASALIVPAFPFVKDWSERKNYGLEKLTNEEIIKDERLIQRIKEEVDELNKNYGHWETIKQFRLLPHEFTIEGNELTPTLKFKRKIISEKYKDLINSIYEG